MPDGLVKPSGTKKDDSFFQKETDEKLQLLGQSKLKHTQSKIIIHQRFSSSWEKIFEHRPGSGFPCRE